MSEPDSKTLRAKRYWLVLAVVLFALAAVIGGIVLRQSMRDPCREWNEAVESKTEDSLDLFSLGGASPLPPALELQVRKQVIREATSTGEVIVEGTTYRRPAGCVTSPAPSLAS
jgi:hypothetical protein